MTPTEFRAALARIDISQQAWARLWGLNPRTVRRWIRGEQDIPLWVARVFDLCAEFPQVGPWLKGLAG